MPTHKSAIKRMRQNPVRRMRNKKVKSRLRTYVNKFEAKLDEGNLDEATEVLRQVESHYDRAASKGVVPQKRASRKVSRLAKRLAEAKA